MANKTYTAVTYMTVRCRSRIDLDGEGASLALTEKPYYNSDTTLFTETGQTSIPEVDQQSLANALTKIIADKLSEGLVLERKDKKPEDIVPPAKGALN